MFDIAVIGAGAAGSAALAALARAGARAIGLDRFRPPHDQGSSHGETRLLRVAYAEGAQYVPMARRAIRLWRELEARGHPDLFRQAGVVYAGPESSPFLSASLASADTYGVDVADMAGAERARLVPALDIPSAWRCCVEREGGYVLAERAIAALLADAAAHGAELRTDDTCRAIEADKSGVRIITARGELRAAKCIVAAGAWAAELLPALAPLLHVQRKTLHWFADPERRHAPGAFRPFLIDDETGHQVYGFPDCASGVKVAEHTAPSAAFAHASEIDRTVGESDSAPVAAAVRRFLPGIGALTRSTTCLYPMSKDGHFIIDAIPDTHGRAFAAVGLSGHGFKFAPVIGETIARLALGQAPEIDAGHFSLKRF